jgi:hypothetical protein
MSVSFTSLCGVKILKEYKEGSVEQRQLNVRPSTINLHADGNITSKLIEQYSAAGC